MNKCNTTWAGLNHAEGARGRRRVGIQERGRSEARRASSVKECGLVLSPVLAATKQRKET